MTFKKAIQLFIENLQGLGKSPNTIELYTYYLSIFNEWLIGQYNRLLYVEEIKPDDLERYIYNELGEDKYSSSARHNMITAFKSLYSFCSRKGYSMNIGKLIRNIKVITKEKAIVDEVEFRKIAKGLNSATAYAVVNTLFYTGLRITECLNLTIGHVDLMNDIITVKQGKGNKDRNIPISDRLKKILIDYLENGRVDMGSKYFFSSKSGKMSRQYVNRVLKSILAAAGIDKKVSCHILRHSFASNLTERGVDILKVQKLLGHESIKTTTIYVHTSIDELQDAINLL